MAPLAAFPGRKQHQKVAWPAHRPTRLRRARAIPHSPARAPTSNPGNRASRSSPDRSPHRGKRSRHQQLVADVLHELAVPLGLRGGRDPVGVGEKPAPTLLAFGQALPGEHVAELLGAGADQRSPEPGRAWRDTCAIRRSSASRFRPVHGGFAAESAAPTCAGCGTSIHAPPRRASQSAGCMPGDADQYRSTSTTAWANACGAS